MQVINTTGNTSIGQWEEHTSVRMNIANVLTRLVVYI